jgi:AcrR family transcriptional regulator
MSDLESKEKIMEVARVLFANQGYEGTSVREIAKAAEVNVASVNYYFNSKENLFQEILKVGYLECASEMRALLQKNNDNLEDTLVDIFKYFTENSHDLVSHFKMMMSSQHSQHFTTQGFEDGTFGPPGGMVIAAVLRKEAPGASDEDIYWALKSLFSHVVHLSITHSCCMKANMDIPFATPTDIQKGIRRLTRIVLSELKNPLQK